MVVGAWLGWALAAPEGFEIVTPRTHEVYRDCECVRLEWDVEGGPSRIEAIPRAEVARFEHVATDGGPHDLYLVRTNGERTLLDQAPCAVVKHAIDRYQLVYPFERVALNAAGEPLADACGDIFSEVRAWDDAQRERREQAVNVVTQAGSALSALVVDRARGDEAAVTALREAVAAQRRSAGFCWAKAAVPRGAAVRWKVSAKAGTAPVVKARALGVPEVDACFDALATGLAPVDGTAKLTASFQPPAAVASSAEGEE